MTRTKGHLHWCMLCRMKDSCRNKPVRKTRNKNAIESGLFDMYGFSLDKFRNIHYP